MNIPFHTMVRAAASGLALLAGQALAQAPDSSTGHGPAEAQDRTHWHGPAQGNGHGDVRSQGHGHRQGQEIGAGHQHRNAQADAAADVTLSTQPETPRAGEETILDFQLADAQGRPLEDLLTHHARKLHVVIVGEDMEVLGHIHPQDFEESIAGGEASVRFAFPRAGRYIVAADIMTEAGPYAEQFLLDVAGEAAEQQPGSATPAKVVVVESQGGDRYTAPILLEGGDKAKGYEISLARPDQIEAGEPATFTFRVTEGGAPVTDLRPFLDAPLHLAVVKEDLGEFLHEHGTVAHATQAGHAAHAAGDRSGGAGHEVQDGGSDGHGMHGYQGPASFGPELTATVTFPEPGRYHLFGQAAHGENILVSRFPVEVR